MSEADFKRHIRARFSGFSSLTEYGKGGTSGIPDLTLVHPSWRRDLFIECKIGKIDKHNYLNFTKVRPSQIQWLRDLRRNGGYGSIVVGVPFGRSYVAFVLPDPLCTEFLSVVRNETVLLTKTKTVSDYDKFEEWLGCCDGIR